MRLSTKIGGMGMKIGVITALAGCLFAVSCTRKQQDPEELKRETAQATAKVKQDAKAVVQGIHEGLTSDRPIDLNQASKAQISALPGINDSRADQIIAARPYSSTAELVSRHILTQEEYDRVKDRVQVGKPSAAIRRLNPERSSNISRSNRGEPEIADTMPPRNGDIH